ncbi:hypothetical protein CUMW_103810 [Citrus unshiu]|nr:hypothetical protein CUMW_103810 [Citrus unshiu]
MKETLRYLAGIAGPSGATSGIGAETARVLAKRGVRVVIPARDLKRAAEVKEGIQRESPNAEVLLFEIDLSSLVSVQRFCHQFLALGLPLNILINNAGVYSKNLEFSEDKIEMTFATNYLGHYLLTEMVLEKMIETAAETGVQGRIINLSSVIHSWVKRDDFCFTRLLNPKNYNGTCAYAQSKLATIMHAKEMSRQLKARNARVTINVVHPGIGASTTCYAALSPQIEGVSGKYFADCNESNCSALANDESEAKKLWKQTRALIHRRLRQPSVKHL